MIKIEAMFRDSKDPNQIACITNQPIVSGMIYKCLYCYFSKNKWFFSWTKSNVQQLMKNEKAKANFRVTTKDLPEDLIELIQQQVDFENRKADSTLLKLKQGTKNV